MVRKHEPVVDLFGEGWLQDPNCVGSSVAAIQWERTRPIGVAGVTGSQSLQKNMSHEIYWNLWMSKTMVTIPISFKAGTLFFFFGKILVG